jgi:hypothetical protein
MFRELSPGSKPPDRQPPLSLQDPFPRIIRQTPQGPVEKREKAPVDASALRSEACPVASGRGDSAEAITQAGSTIGFAFLSSNPHYSTVPAGVRDSSPGSLDPGEDRAPKPAHRRRCRQSFEVGIDYGNARFLQQPPQLIQRRYLSVVVLLSPDRPADGSHGGRPRKESAISRNRFLVAKTMWGVRLMHLAATGRFRSFS